MAIIAAFLNRRSGDHEIKSFPNEVSPDLPLKAHNLVPEFTVLPAGQAFQGPPTTNRTELAV
jgi:hypothetical protein